MFKWKDEFSCNIEEIDKQHKYLFELATKVYDLLLTKEKDDFHDEIMNIVDELKEYAVYHFGYEEKLMREYGFELVENHIVEHRNFLEKMKKINSEEIDIKQSKVIMDIILFITDWITNHILKTDFKYKDFLNEKGVV